MEALIIGKGRHFHLHSVINSAVDKSNNSLRYVIGGIFYVVAIAQVLHIVNNFWLPCMYLCWDVKEIVLTRLWKAYFPYTKKLTSRIVCNTCDVSIIQAYAYMCIITRWPHSLMVNGFWLGNLRFWFWIPTSPQWCTVGKGTYFLAWLRCK